MITRPLDLAGKLRSEPRSFDWMFWVNAAAVVLFFGVFGSRFVLAPGLGVDFRLPVVVGAAASAKAPTHMISVTEGGKIFTSDGLRDLKELTPWLEDQVHGAGAPVLLVRADDGVSLAMQADITNAAQSVGFEVIFAAEDPALNRVRKGR